MARLRPSDRCGARVSYIDDFGRELRLHGIRGTRRCRILAEVIDHLDEDPSAEERFGSAAEVANAFAAELGAQASRRAAVSAFAALGVAGAVYAVCFVSFGFASPPTEMLDPALGQLAFVLMVVAPQVAFVAGALALVRSLRRRRERVIPTDELIVIRRRTGVALLFGLLTMAALALFAYEFRADSRGLVADAYLHVDCRRLGSACSRRRSCTHHQAPPAADPRRGGRRFRRRRPALRPRPVAFRARRVGRRRAPRLARGRAPGRSVRRPDPEVSSKDSPVSAGSSCSESTSGSAASIDGCPSPRPSAISRT